MNSSISVTDQKLVKSFSVSISWEAGLLFIFPLLTLFGNLLVVISVATEKCLHNATNYFIVSLAVADICLAVLVMPLASLVEMYNGIWIYSQLFCDVYMMFDVFFCTASIMNLTAISLDRYVAVSHPLQYAKHNNTLRVNLTMGIVWILSFCISLPIACGLNHSDRSQFPTTCDFLNADFIVYSSLGSFFLPTILMIWLYYCIFRVIRRQTLTLRTTQEPKQCAVVKNHHNTNNCSAKAVKHDINKRPEIVKNAQYQTSPIKPLNQECRPKTCSYKPMVEMSTPTHSRTQSMQFSNHIYENCSFGDKRNESNHYTKLKNDDLYRSKRDRLSLSDKYKIPRSATDYFYCSKEFLKKIVTIKNECFERFIELDNLKCAKCQMFYNPFGDTEDLNQIVSPHLSLSSLQSFDEEDDSEVVTPTEEFDDLNNDVVEKITRATIYSNSVVIGSLDRLQTKKNPVSSLKISLAKRLSPIKESIEIHRKYHQTLSSSSIEFKKRNENTCRFACQPFKKWKFQFICNCSLMKKNVKKKKQEKNVIKREKKAIKTLAIVLGAFLFCWMPFFVANMTNAICFKTESHTNSIRKFICPLPQTLMSICVWLGYINSFLNPVIYTVCNAEFRRIFKKLLHIS